jgi:hypothetical protein
VTPVRWLLVKDLQILRRSPLQTTVLAVYPIVIALMIGFALSSPPSKPTVAVYSGISPSHATLKLGSQRLDIESYAEQLYAAVHTIRVRTPAAAVKDVRDGRALAALIIPADLLSQIESLASSGTGSPTVQIVLNDSNPIDRAFVEQTLQSKVDAVEQGISKRVLQVATRDLQEILYGGNISVLGRNVSLLGLSRARALLSEALAARPRNAAAAAKLQSVIRFADEAIIGLTFASPVLGSIGNPVDVVKTGVAGRTTPSATYAVAIAAVVSLMFVALLLAAGMLALERSENAYSRLVRGLVSPGALLAEKAVLAAGCAAALTLVMSAVVSVFVPLDWGRVELWVVGLGFGGFAFGALGVALGGLAREVSAASLLAFLLSLPVAFVALVPATAVSHSVWEVLQVISFVFPFRAALDAVSNAFAATSPGIGLPLLHLLGLAVVFGVLARLALRRFAEGRV